MSLQNSARNPTFVVHDNEERNRERRIEAQSPTFTAENNPFGQEVAGRPVQYSSMEVIPIDAIAYLSGVNWSSVWKVMLAIHAIDCMTPVDHGALVDPGRVPQQRMNVRDPAFDDRKKQASRFVRRVAAQRLFHDVFEQYLKTNARLGGKL